MLYVVNAFSLNMLKGKCRLACEIIGKEEARKIWADPDNMLVGKTAAIGHKDMAKIAGDDLGTVISESRASVKVEAGDILLIAQYTGPRLPEGATVLPEGAKITWWKVSVG